MSGVRQYKIHPYRKPRAVGRPSYAQLAEEQKERLRKNAFSANDSLKVKATSAFLEQHAKDVMQGIALEYAIDHRSYAKHLLEDLGVE